jgi:hypothetical protein
VEQTGELYEKPLVSTGFDICLQNDPDNKSPVLTEIKDKLIQDVDE